MKVKHTSAQLLGREIQCLSQTIEDMRGVYRHVEPMNIEPPHYACASGTRRIANTGHFALTVLACWPSYSGHDYDVVACGGLSARLRNGGASPILLEER